MAKMFYTLEEAAGKLGVSAEKVREMASSGQLQEFRDRDRLVFKVEQVNMLAGSDEGDDSIPLADSGAEIALAVDDSRTGSGAAGAEGTTKDKSGISIFEGDDSEDTDASAQTQITSSVGGITMGDPGNSGSGLLDITKSGDDTSLNAGLLEDVYQGGGRNDASADENSGGGLFENTGVASDVGVGAGSPAMAMMLAEPYDAAWSGIGGGVALGLTLVAGVMLSVVIVAAMGVSNFALTTFLTGNVLMSAGIFAGLILVSTLIGFVLGRKG
jgi:hypothetical protein